MFAGLQYFAGLSDLGGAFKGPIVLQLISCPFDIAPFFTFCCNLSFNYKMNFSCDSSKITHLTSGDAAGEKLAVASLPGEVLIWRDILYDGPRLPSWPDEKVLESRAGFLAETTGSGMAQEQILESLRNQYRSLKKASANQIVLWFDACLFDQSMLAHVLTCLRSCAARHVELLCVAAFPGIEPFHGLGQLTAAELASLYDQRKTVTAAQFEFAGEVDRAFALQDRAALRWLAALTGAPLPHIPAAAARWLQELPDPSTGLGRLETLALAAVRAGCSTPGQIFRHVAAEDAPPQFWGDTTLWAKLNNLAARQPPLITITGPADRLPLWQSEMPIESFRVSVN